MALLFCAGCSDGSDPLTPDAGRRDDGSAGDGSSQTENDQNTDQTGADETQTTVDEDPPNEAEIDPQRFDQPGSLALTQQLGTPYDDFGLVLVAQDGFIYMAGITSGDLNGNRNQRPGTFDVFVMKLTTDGTPVWTTQWGTIAQEGVNQIVMQYDASSASLVLAGDTLGSFRGFGNEGNCGTAQSPALLRGYFLVPCRC